jgi:hypothetical protein
VHETVSHFVHTILSEEKYMDGYNNTNLVYLAIQGKHHKQKEEAITV